MGLTRNLGNLSNILTQNGVYAQQATPSQFDNGTNLSTTGFVQRALGNFQTSVVYTTSQTLTAASAGTAIVFNSTSALACTLPLNSTCQPGTSFYIANNNTGTLTIQTQGSDTLLYIGNATTGSKVLNAGDTAFITYISSGQWHIINGSTQLGSTNAFSASKITSGYQKLPSGMIFQWGTVSFASISTGAFNYVTVTLPTAYPTSNLLQYATLAGNQFGVSSWVTLDVEQVTTSNFKVCISSSSGISSTQSVNWMAIGY